MKKKMMGVVCMLCCAMELMAQKPVTGCPASLFHASQLTDTSCDRSLKEINVTSSGNVQIKLQNGDKKYVSQDSLWGMREKNRNPNRFYQGGYYTVDNLMPLIQYHRKVGRSTRNYFSISPDGPIFLLSSRELKQYADSATYAAFAQLSVQSRHELAFDFYALNTKLLNNHLWGGGFEMKYFPTKRWATGLRFSVAAKTVKDTFGYSIISPLLSYLEVGWINQFEILQKETFRMGVNLTNGFAMSELRDKAQQEKKRTRYGEKSVAKMIATNYYYLLQPGIDASYQLFSNNHNPAFFFNAKARYSLGFGKSGFGEEDVFNGYHFSIGLSLIGFDRVQF